MPPRDPYRYFRVEARDLVAGLAAGLLAFDRDGARPETVRELMRLAHTLKGAARVVELPAVAEPARELEDALLALPAGEVPAATLRSLNAHLDAVRDGVAAIDAPVPIQGEARPIAPTAPVLRLDAARVPLAELDALLGAVTEVGVAFAELADGLTDLGELERLARAAGEAAPSESTRALVAVAERMRRVASRQLTTVGRELDALRSDVDALRLLPASIVFDDVERAARDAAGTLGKRVDVVASGHDVRADAHVLEAVRGALVHLVRNAVAHGIEAPARRGTAGKAPAGRVDVTVARAGSRISITCADDGAGIDVPAVAARLVAAGRWDPAAPATLDGVVAELLRGGVTTSATTDISGRGVGLDAVRHIVEELGGAVSVASTPGRGTTVRLALPVSLASVSATRVHLGGGRAALVPLDAVRRVVRLTPGAVVRAGDHEVLEVGGDAVPFLRLAPALGVADPPPPRAAVVIEADEVRAALGVERVAGVERVVVRALPDVVGGAAVIAGAVLDRRGHPELMVSPEAAVALAGAARVAPEPAPAAPPAVLVIDDSLTTRMLEQSILEAAGFVVDLAASAEEGLEIARRRRYDVFLVDVEMPGMDGFTFVERTRADPDLRGTPAIIVTSRAAPEDLRRGRDAGASAYIVKSSFDQGELLAAIRRLVG